jgi:hypothetical protein
LWRNVAGQGGGAESTVQVGIVWDSVPDQASFLFNDILHELPGEPVFFWLDAPGRTNFSLGEYEAAFPALAAGNIEADPLFVDAAGGDFHLSAGSPCIDAGGALTSAVGAGSGTVVEVADPLFFSDGHGIVDPDTIRVDGERVRIVQVDYDTNRITVDRDVAWTAGAPVTLDYEGTGPDMGAFEYLEPVPEAVLYRGTVLSLDPGWGETGLPLDADNHDDTAPFPLTTSIPGEEVDPLPAAGPLISYSLLLNGDLPPPDGTVLRVSRLPAGTLVSFR